MMDFYVFVFESLRFRSTFFYLYDSHVINKEWRLLNPFFCSAKVNLLIQSFSYISWNSETYSAKHGSNGSFGFFCEFKFTGVP